MLRREAVSVEAVSSNRIQKIKSRLFEHDFMTKKEWWGDNETILTSDEVKAKPLIIRKSLAVQHVARYMPIEVKDYELIVGLPTMASVGFGKCFPDYALPEEKAEAAKHGFTVKSIFGHHPANFEKLLKLGPCGIREQIFKKMGSIGNDVSRQDEYDLYSSMIISLDTLRELSDRYVELLIAKAKQEKDVERRAELVEMAKVCSRVPENRPETLHEALQTMWLAFTLLHSTMEFVPVGRSDQYLYPFYERDIREGRITKEYAEELIGSWLAKFSERVHLNPKDWELWMTDADTQYNGMDENASTAGTYENNADYNYGTSANHWLVNMILGGRTIDGKDETNELSYVILQQWRYLEPVCPVMAVRFHKNSPGKLYRLCADILRGGSGEPAIYNDEQIIPGLIAMGIPPEEAAGYSNDGCWETLIPGKTSLGFCMLQVLQMLEYTLQGGRSLARDRLEQENVPSPDTWNTYEAFYQVFLDILEKTAAYEIESRKRHIRARARIAPSPLLSALMDDCIERGREYSIGGSRYNIFGVFLCGFGNCVDSLAAIKKIVFEEKKLTLPQMAELTRKNFEGAEPIRQMLINDVPKFGNDDDYVDQIASELMHDYDMIIRRLRKNDNDGMMLGLGIATFEFYAKWGHDVGASADGRLAQEPVGSNMSPSIGCDITGPTAAIKSITKPDVTPYTIGAPLDMQINPDEIKGEAGLSRLVGLIKGFVNLGGLILTITGVSKETLIDAQREPMRHKSLRVRLGGLSAYFITLSKEMQESIIKRASHSI